jgi:large subunit ribosomal protein L10
MTEQGYRARVSPEKAAAVAEIKDRLERAGAVLLTEYRGLTVGELAALRRELSQADVEYRVVKNTLTVRAASELGIEMPRDVLEGPTAVAYCYGDPVRGAKAISTFAREHPALVLKGGLLERRFMTEAEARGLATVDPLEVSLAKIAGSLTGPLTQIVGILEAPVSRIVYVLEQLAARGES